MPKEKKPWHITSQLKYFFMSDCRTNHLDIYPPSNENKIKSVENIEKFNQSFKKSKYLRTISYRIYFTSLRE